MASSNFPGSWSAEASKSWRSVPSQGQSGYSGQVNSYSQPGSVSSYRSALAPHTQSGSVVQRLGMREPSGEKRYGSSVVSSGAIEMRAPPQMHSNSPGTGLPQTNDGMLDRARLQSANSQASASRLPKQHPAFSAPAVLQSKEGMWDTVKLPSAKSPEQAARRPHQNPTFSAPAVQQTKADPWRSIYSPSAKSPDFTSRRRQHTHPVPAVLKARPDELDIYTSRAKTPEYTAQRHQRPSSFSAPTVLQNKNMWGSMSSPDSSKLIAANPRSSRPLTSGYASRGQQSGRHAAQQQARLLASQPQSGSLASRVPQKEAVLKKETGPRSSRPVNMAPLYQDGRWQTQLS